MHAVYEHFVVNLLYPDTVQPNTQTPRDLPYTFLQMFLITAGEFRDFPEEILAWFAQTIFFCQLLLCYYQ